ncbi:hypothetical protein BpHYR1_001392 [Brachionus plicatilis]|uniref:Uncharacterized protein n=1 Tax=Brachionus plicatilis TaxID=10195 RepID=A0A3M7QFH3_BRAPC|nr:hypothetical protein BpHYR1_001392 [Brachionus plicatilis]
MSFYRLPMRDIIIQKILKKYLCLKTENKFRNFVFKDLTFVSSEKISDFLQNLEFDFTNLYNIVLIAESFLHNKKKNYSFLTFYTFIDDKKRSIDNTAWLKNVEILIIYIPL